MALEKNSQYRTPESAPVYFESLGKPAQTARQTGTNNEPLQGGNNVKKKE
jgi:hypothetical protein